MKDVKHDLFENPFNLDSQNKLYMKSRRDEMPQKEALSHLFLPYTNSLSFLIFFKISSSYSSLEAQTALQLVFSP